MLIEPAFSELTERHRRELQAADSGECALDISWDDFRAFRLPRAV